jgi:uncharacterized protein
LAHSGVVTGTLKTVTFGSLGVLMPPLVVFAVVIGVATMPGGFAARAILRVLPMTVHAALLDGVILLGGAALLWRAFS